MMGDSLVCKQCLQADRKTKLRLYHLNFHEALYMCPVKKCFFPLFKKEIRDYIVPYKTSVSESDLCESEEESEQPELKCVAAAVSNLNVSRLEKLNLSECLKTSSLISIPEINLACQISHVDNFQLVDKHSTKDSSQSPHCVNESLPGMEQCNGHVNSVVQSRTANNNGETNLKKSDLCLSPRQINVPVVEHLSTERKVPVRLDAMDSSYIFPVWHDRDSLSWLDAPLALLVCNKKLKDVVISSNVRSHLKKFSCVYNDALCRLNTSSLDFSKNRYQLSLSTILCIKKELKCAQKEMFNFLQPVLYPESKDLPVLAIENLLKEDAMIRNLFLVSYGWDMTCWSCGACIRERKQNTVLKLLDGCPDFSLEYPYYERPCPTCKKAEQKMFFHFTEHPPKTMLLYFGAGCSKLNAADLHNIAANRNHYQVTGILQYVIESSHYIAWIRNPVDGSWLCFDDWGPVYQQYSYEAPQISGNEISLVMWEQDESASKTSAKIGGILSVNEYLARLKSLSSSTNHIKHSNKMYKTLFSNYDLQAVNNSKKLSPLKKKCTSAVHSSEKASPYKEVFVNEENFLYAKAKSFSQSVASAQGSVKDPSVSVLGHLGRGTMVKHGTMASTDYSFSNGEPPLTVRNISEKLNVRSCVKGDSCWEKKYECPLILQAVGMIRKSDYDKVLAKKSKSQRNRCFTTLPATSLIGGLFPFPSVRLPKSQTAEKQKPKCKRTQQASRAKKAKVSSDVSMTIKSDKKTTTSDKKPHLEEDFNFCPEAVVEVEVSTCNNIMDVENSPPSFGKLVNKKRNKIMTKTKGAKQEKNEKVTKTNCARGATSRKRGKKKQKTGDTEEGKDAECFESFGHSSEKHLSERYKLFTPLNFSKPPSEYLRPSENSTSMVELSVDSFDISVELEPVPSSNLIPERNMDSESSEDLTVLKRSVKNYSQSYKNM